MEVIIVTMVAFASFLLGLFCSGIFLLRRQRSERRNDEPSSLLEVVTEPKAREQLNNFKDFRLTTHSFSSRGKSLDLPDSKIALTLVELSKQLPRDLQIQLLEIANSIVYDVSEQDPSARKDEKPGKEEVTLGELKQWAGVELGEVVPAVDDHAKKNTPKDARDPGLDFNALWLTGLNETKPEDLPTKLWLSGDGGLAKPDALEDEQPRQNTSTESRLPNMRMRTSSTTDLRSDAEKLRQTSNGGFRATTIADEVASTLRGMAKESDPEQGGVLLEIATKILQRNLYDAIVEWSPEGHSGEAGPPDVDDDLREWLQKDYFLGTSSAMVDHHDDERRAENTPLSRARGRLNSIDGVLLNRTTSDHLTSICSIGSQRSTTVDGTQSFVQVHGKNGGAHLNLNTVGAICAQTIPSPLQDEAGIDRRIVADDARTTRPGDSALTKADSSSDLETTSSTDLENVVTQADTSRRHKRSLKQVVATIVKQQTQHRVNSLFAAKPSTLRFVSNKKEGLRRRTRMGSSFGALDASIEEVEESPSLFVPNQKQPSNAEVPPEADEALKKEYGDFLKLLDDPVLQALVSKRDEYEFNLFAFMQVFPGKPLTTLGYIIFNDHEFPNIFGFTAFDLWYFLRDVELGMRKDVPFHNSAHVADVLQTLHALLIQCKFVEWATSFEVYGMLLACTIHDYDHPGVNNAFLINSRDPLAVLYNDQSVLENHHAASGFGLILNNHASIIDCMPKEDSARLRAMVIGLIQTTDMKLHFSFLSEAQSNLSSMQVLMQEYSYNSEFFEGLEEVDRMILFKMALKCADISNPSKPFDTYQQWTGRVMEEFFNQGDKEKVMGLEVSPMCDRLTTRVYKSQIGFIEFVVLPLFNAFSMVAPWVGERVLPQLLENKERHKKLGEVEQFGLPAPNC